MSLNPAKSTVKLAIFDKDGTLVEPVSGNTFVQNPEDQRLLPGVKEGLTALALDGWSFAIASNQGGVGAGFKTLESTIAEMHYCCKLMGVDVADVIFCPDMDGKECYCISDGELVAINDTESNLPFPCKDFRKPQPGMILLAQALQILFVESVIFIGDRPEDQQAAAAAGVEFQWADDWRNQFIDGNV